MVEGQKAIYYVLASDLDSARHSPHLDPLQARGIEALLLVDLVDSFMISSLREYEGLKLINADSPDLELPEINDDSSGESLTADLFEALAGRVKDVLGERVTEVRASRTLRQNPARLVSADNTTRDHHRVQRLINRDYEVPASALEINDRHPLINSLAQITRSRPDDPLAPLLIEQLYDSALLLDGLHPNPAQMVPRIQRLMEAAAQAGDPAQAQAE
jgi:molecular chaperone HtpG